MIPSSLELNSDDFPFFGDLKRTSGSREKLEKSSFENRDNHHWPGGSEMSRWWWWWWWWWLEKIRKTKIQTQRQIQRQIHTHKYRKIPNTQSQKDRGRFDTRGSPVALLFLKIWPEIQKNEEIQKSRNPKIQKKLFLLWICKALKISVVLTPVDLR